MHIVKHLRALADRAAYSRVVTTKWMKDWAEVEFTDPDTGEIRTEWVVAASRPGTRKRRVHRRVKRWRNVRGFQVLNDGIAAVGGVARIMQHYLHEVEQTEGYDVMLLSGLPEEPDWFEPMTRDEVADVLAGGQYSATASRVLLAR